MDGSRRSPPADDASAQRAVRDAVARAIADHVPAGARIGVALSGGRDSVALLDAAVARFALPARDVVAIHVDHALSPHASAWSQFCRELCAAYPIACDVREVRVATGPRISVESAARSARYAALAESARAHDVVAVLLGHHADDQAETLLLQLARGAGPAGLAAMPAARRRDGVLWLRPLLEIGRSDIDHYATARGLRYVNDDSNTHARYRRNALRAHVIPALRSIAPGYPHTFVRSASLQADAAELANDLAQIDARDAYDGATLDCALLRALPPHRGCNVLRWFLREQQLAAPSRARLAEMLRQLAGESTRSRVAMRHDGVELGVHRGRLAVHARTVEPFSHTWTGAETVALPHGRLTSTHEHGAGIASHHLAGPPVTIRSGTVGERLRLPGRQSPRRVTELLREAGVAPWDRAGVPRVYIGGALVAVPMLGTDAAFAARADDPGLTFDWHAAPASDASA